MTDERRSDKRVPLTLEVHWEGLSGRRTARINDISLGGCYVESLAQVSVGEAIRFDVQLPTGQWIPLKGEVVYQQEGLGFGVRFLELSEFDRSLLLSVIE